MRVKVIILATAILGSSVLAADELVFNCGPVSGIFDDSTADHETDIETTVFRFNYRTEKHPTIFQVNEERFVRRRVDGKGLFGDGSAAEWEGKTLYLYENGPIWRFMTVEWPTGQVRYVYDSNRKILARTHNEYAYDPGDDPDPASGLISIRLTIYSCDLQKK